MYSNCHKENYIEYIKEEDNKNNKWWKLRKLFTYLSLLNDRGIT
jgi:hypothetical protein